VDGGAALGVAPVRGSSLPQTVHSLALVGCGVPQRVQKITDRPSPGARRRDARGAVPYSRADVRV
jgi:hypothetical protein